MTESEIQEMCARGFDAATVQSARDAFERGKVADRLMERIAGAFSGVTLGDGIGLKEAQGLDDYEDEATRAAYRETDEKDDWRRISVADLNHCFSSLSFFDPQGMRFHLPAYMTAELRGEYRFGMAFCLTRLDDHGRSYFTALSDGQRQVVREFLLLLRGDPDYEFDRDDIDRALDTFWVAIDASSGKASPHS